MLVIILEGNTDHLVGRRVGETDLAYLTIDLNETIGGETSLA